MIRISLIRSGGLASSFLLVVLAAASLSLLSVVLVVTPSGTGGGYYCNDVDEVDATGSNEVMSDDSSQSGAQDDGLQSRLRRLRETCRRLGLEGRGTFAIDNGYGLLVDTDHKMAYCENAKVRKGDMRSFRHM